jgi:hypothetical protein
VHPKPQEKIDRVKSRRHFFQFFSSDSSAPEEEHRRIFFMCRATASGFTSS